MPKEKIDVKPSEPVKQDKDKKEKNNQKTKNAKHLEVIQIDAEGSITVGNTVAEIDVANIRKNVLRT